MNKMEIKIRVDLPVSFINLNVICTFYEPNTSLWVCGWAIV